MMEGSTFQVNDFDGLMDFKSLKQCGMELIQELSGSAWTNLNNSDPGVTILEQVVYAMTEFGYCSSFPIEDILTDQNNQIQFKNQFYTAREIFEKAPVSLSEYQQYIKNINKSILAVGCKTFNARQDFIKGTYSFFLCVNPAVIDPGSLAYEIYFQLNKVRSLGEIFVLPLIVPTTKCTIQGTVVLKNRIPEGGLVSELSLALRTYLANKWEGFFDKNILENDPNGTRVNAFEFSHCAVNVSNIQTLRDIYIIHPDGSKTDYLNLTPENFTFLDIEESFRTESLKLVYENLNIELTDSLNIGKTNGFHAKEPECPEITGNFRDISDYFSIQETFPALYKVGVHATENSNNNYETAVSRQLRGYLLLIDQLLSNQFAQLGHIPELFSFNALNVANYSVLQKYKEGISDQGYLQYPAAELYFTPTYFYNTLYQVPYVMPLLKHHSIFENDKPGVDTSLIQKKAFDEFIADPYNTYNQALLSYSATNKVNLSRKNEMLSHLLARHGIAPQVIDCLCKGAYYTGVGTMDSILTKSALLINFGKLSSRRNCGYNFLAATKITYPIHNKTNGSQKEPHESWVNDTVLDPASIYKQLQVSQQDIINFSAFELCSWLLLGFKPVYEYAIYELENKEIGFRDKERLNQLNWFCHERKGFIFIEEVLLRVLAVYRIELLNGTSAKPEFIIYPELTFNELVQFKIKAGDSKQWLSQIAINGWFQLDKKKFIVQPNSSGSHGAINEIKSSSLNYLVTALYGEQEFSENSNKSSGQTVYFIMPAYVPLLSSSEFIEKIELFISEYLPVQITPKLIYLSQSELEEFLPLYTEWHNLMQWKEDKASDNTVSHNVGGNLLNRLLKFGHHV